MDNLIEGIQSIVAKNRCSLSDDDVTILTEAIEMLEKLKANKHDKAFVKNEIAKICFELMKVFLSHEVLNYLNHLR